VKSFQLDRILNQEPNPYQDIHSFKRGLLLDFIVDGNMFMYWDGAFLYHLPATKMNVISDESTYVNRYEYDGGAIVYKPTEIIHVKDNNYQSLYRGSSRLKPANNASAT
jgi:phage portal protein BeeE